MHEGAFTVEREVDVNLGKLARVWGSRVQRAAKSALLDRSCLVLVLERVQALEIEDLRELVERVDAQFCKRRIKQIGLRDLVWIGS